jgi:adenosylcobinamide-phosphate synthase
MKYHLIAFLTGCILDLIIGDPYWMPHPIRLIGKLIGTLEKRFLGSGESIAERKPRREMAFGAIACFIVLVTTVLLSGAVMILSYMINSYLGMAVESVLTCYILAARSLEKESMKVYYALKNKDVEGARLAVSMIVGRDTESLDEKGIARAAVETVAENTSDGVIAPLIYTFIGGPVLGLTYKAINTMDSMVGYHSDRYEYYGKVPAILDDVVNYIPARISAIFMILSAFILGKDFSGKDAFRIFKRDRYNHKSPNSAQTESVCAGALGLQLAGDAYYFGKLVKKPYIGDATREIEPEDIKRACKLMLTSATGTVLLACAISATGTVLLAHF